MTRQSARFWLICLVTFTTASAVRADAPADNTPPDAFRSFAERVAAVPQRLPIIVTAAEAAAAQKAAHPDTLIDIEYGMQPAFAEELLNRSGGLAGALPSIERRALLTDHDITLFSVRSWETDAGQTRQYLEACKKKGWTIVLFASQAGMPEDIKVDFLIDNGAPDGSAAHAPVNVLTNAMHGWVWVCEYTAALTRLGHHPGFLQSITTPGSVAHNAIFQNRKTRHHIYRCDTKIPVGDLAGIYMSRVNRLLHDVAGDKTQSELDHAADIIAERLNTGRRVFVSTNTHVMLSEIHEPAKSPWTSINTLRNMEQVLHNKTRPGDLFFWLAFNGVSIWWYPDDGPSQLFIDYDTPLRASKLDVITCFAHDPLHPKNNGDYALAHIEQNWNYGDSTVPVPFPPGRIAPISGLYQSLLYRMLDDKVDAQLTGPEAPSPEAPAPESY